MAAPSIPSRPARSQNIDVPSIPPRPKRTVDRSVSPSRDSYARSPLNDPIYLPPSSKPQISSSLSRSISRDIPSRPPSVSLPSVGQEGNEYAHFGESDAENDEQTKIVSGELPLHAPLASLPASTAKARVAAVTRTDSNSAAAAGIGRPSEHTERRQHHQSQLGYELSRSSSAQQKSRPGSLYKQDMEHDDHGIPEIGQQIPLLAFAGDVQAPTPGPYSSRASGSGHLGPQGEGKNHFRTKSGREVFRGPPGSYGMHGHGIVDTKDPFEKAWYDKHPEALAREASGEYGPKIPVDRKEYNLSSADLNKLVHAHVVDTPDRNSVGTPDEQIGYLASEEYAQRISRPASAAKRRSLQYNESPLKQQTDGQGAKDDDEEDEVIHIDHPNYRAPAEGNGPLDSSPYDQVLASDSRRNSSSSNFQPPAHLQRFSSHASDREQTPLEGVKEYEPLFPEDEDSSKPRKSKKPPSLHDGEGARHHFPSKDIWEDVPDSVHYETTVQTPQIPEFSRREAEHEDKEIFESLEAEEARNTRQVPAEQQLLGTAAAIQPPKEMIKPQFKKEVAADIPTRPSYKHRFPSQDVWEDTPESAMHTATIASEEEGGPVDQRAIHGKPKPIVPPRPAKQLSGDSSDGSLSRSVSKEEEPYFSKQKPPVPARPVGSKISALRGAFMNDLESRLKVGPQPVPTAKEEEEEIEKAPLADARKGRARGPARRKPGQQTEHRGAAKVSFVSAITIWEIDEEGSVAITTDVAKKDTPKTPEKKLSTDSTVQTGQIDLELPKEPGAHPTEKATVYVEGRAQDGGSELVKHNEDGSTTTEVVTEASVAPLTTSTGV